MEIIKRLFSPESYVPHGYCRLWDWKLILLHAVSDSLIPLAYLSIPFTLLYFVRQRRDLPFSRIFGASPCSTPGPKDSLVTAGKSY
jgi:hypothetical protein